MKKPLILLLLISFIVFATTLAAQPNDSLFNGTPLPSIVDAYKTETIHLRFATYVKNGHSYNIGIVGERLKREMIISPDAMAFYKKYQKQKRWSLVCAGLQLITEVAAFTSKNKSRRTGLFISGGAFSIVAIPLFIGSTQNLNKAVWIRNGEVMSRQ